KACSCLAGVVRAAAEKVAAGERVGKRRGLDRGRDLDALASQDGGQACGHAEGSKGCHRTAICTGVSPTAGIRVVRAASHGAVSAATTCGQLAARARRADVPSVAEDRLPTRIAEARRRCLVGDAGPHWTEGGPARPRWRRTLLPREVSAMTHGDSLTLTVQATQRSLEERLGEALL